MPSPSPVIGVVVEPETDEDHAKLGAALERLAIEDPIVPRPDRRRDRPDRDLRDGRAPPRDHRRPPAPRVRRRRRASAIRRSPTARPSPGAPRARTSSSRQPAAARRVRPRPARRRADRPRRRLRVRESRPAAATSRRSTPRPSRRESPRPSSAACSPAIPMTDLRVQVVGGSYHPVDSNDYAFKIAGVEAFVAAAAQGQPRPSSSR